VLQLNSKRGVQGAAQGRDPLGALGLYVLRPAALVVAEVLHPAVLFSLPSGSGGPSQLALSHTCLPCFVDPH
jgi:hypothetical protein